MNRLFDRRHPGAAAGSIAKRQKLVAGRERRGARQQHVLDVVEFEHRDLLVLADLAGDRQIRALGYVRSESRYLGNHCIWSSMVENAAFSLRAFLISVALA